MLKLAALFALVGVPVSILAEETVPALPPWATWGVLGMVIAGILTRQLVPGWSYKDQQEEIKTLKADNSRLVNLVLETQKATLPVIEASTSAVSEALNEIRAIRRTQ